MLLSQISPTQARKIFIYILHIQNKNNNNYEKSLVTLCETIELYDFGKKFSWDLPWHRRNERSISRLFFFVSTSANIADLLLLISTSNPQPKILSPDLHKKTKKQVLNRGLIALIHKRTLTMITKDSTKKTPASLKISFWTQPMFCPIFSLSYPNINKNTIYNNNNTGWGWGLSNAFICVTGALE